MQSSGSVGGFLLEAATSYWAWILLCSILVRPLCNRYTSRLRQFPGPFTASCTRLWKVWSTWSGHTEQHHIELHRKYGPVVRIAPNEVSFASPRAALELFKTGKGFHKTDFYWVFPPPENPDIFTEIREDVHAVKKRYATKPYSLGALRAHVPRIEDTGQLLIQKLDGFVEKPRCDLGEWLHFFAFDVLGEVAFSQKFGFLEAGVDVDNCIRTIDDSQVYNGIVGCVPFWDYFLRRNPLWRLVPTLSTGNALITRVAQTQLESRQKLHRSDKSGGSKDLLDGLIEAQREHPEALSDGDVFAIAHGAIFAGSDSTASTMQSFFWHVLSDARVYGRLTDEMQSATLSEFVTYNEASGLPYFQACLKEAMRMRPAVGVNISRKVPPEGAEIDGTWLPGGVSVAVNGWVLHRDREVFGQDADTYRPERWIESEDAEKLRMMERCMFQFGGGSHVCIGRHLALLEMNMIVPQLLRRYAFDLVHPGRPLQYRSSFFVVQSGLLVRVQRRRE